VNAREAKAYVLRCMAAEARHHEGNASEWLEHPLTADGIQVDEHDLFSEADYRRNVRALNELADELERRAQRIIERLRPSATSRRKAR
jgi:hypothetical protein